MTDRWIAHPFLRQGLPLLRGFLLLRRLLPAGLVLALLLGACGGREPVTAEEQGTAVHYFDFSILPPGGAGWVHAGRTEHAIAFGRRLSETHTLLAQAGERQTPRALAGQGELMAEVRAEWTRSAASERRRNVQSDVRADRRGGGACVWFRRQSEDHGAVNRGAAPYLLQRAVGLLCLHPSRPRHLVRVTFSERALPAELSADFAAQAERFLDTLRLAGMP